jgi:hypothetical protein
VPPVPTLRPVSIAISAAREQFPFLFQAELTPHFLDNRLADGAEAVRLQRWLPANISEAQSTSGHNAAGRI